MQESTLQGSHTWHIGLASRLMNKIMEMQYSFYNELFTAKPTIPILESKYDYLTDSLPKLPEQQQELLDSDITIEELEFVITHSELNKAPGPDGYSNEFFKTFCTELIQWIFRSYQHAIKTNLLSRNVKRGTITCIPKQGKDRNLLKYWRPLTMLNSTYNFFSAILANRLK